MVATPYRHGSKQEAESFFLSGMTQAMQRLAERSHPTLPITIYYAFKQSEKKGEGLTSTGWETFLDAAISVGFTITGTWPVRTERGARALAIGTNALASSIVLVCRPRPADAPMATRREFVDALKEELPAALRTMQAGSIAPVDLAQAAIGPGMAVFSRYARVLDVSGRPLSVRDALSLINQTLEEALAEQEGDFDADTRWAVAWFEQAGFNQGEFGVAETLSKAKNTSVDGMIEAGILKAGAGKVRLLRPAELPDDWDPQTDRRRTVWEMVHHLIRLHGQAGEGGAAILLAKLRADAESARDLAYRLYRICEQKNRAQEALGYNALVQSWPEIARLARERPRVEQARVDRRGWNDAMTTETVIETMVERIVARFQPARILLFGSRARGTANRWSDVDLLVVMEEVTDKRRAAVEMGRVLSDLPVSKDIIVTTPEEIARRGHLVGSVLRAALRDGKVVYERP